VISVTAYHRSSLKASSVTNGSLMLRDERIARVEDHEKTLQCVIGTLKFESEARIELLHDIVGNRDMPHNNRDAT